MSMPAGWDVLGLPGDPAPGDPAQVRALAGRLLDEARLAVDSSRKLAGVASGSDAIKMRGDYATSYREALGELPGEVAKLGTAYGGAGEALMTYAGHLERARSQASAALRHGTAAAEQYQGALREIQASLPGATGGLPELESAVSAADPAVQASVRPAVQRARNADADRARARRLADEAARLRGDAENRAVEHIERALEGSGIKNRTWLQKALDTVSAPFRSWDAFVDFAGKVALVAGVIVLVIGTGGMAGVILAGVAVAASAVVLGNTLNKYRQGKATLGQVALDALGVIPGGRTAGLLAKGGAALRGAATAIRGGGGGRLAGPGARAGSLRAAAGSAKGRGSTAAGSAWTKNKQAFSDDPVHFPTGVVILPQRDVELPGVLPLVLERTHLSDYASGRWFGRSWSSTLDQRLEIDDAGVCLATASGALLVFPHPDDDRAVHPERGPLLELRRQAGSYTVTDHATGLTTHFSGFFGDLGTVPVTAVTDRNGNRIDFRYTPEGLPSEVVHSGGYHLDIETHDGLVASIRLRGAGQTLLTYGYESGDLVEVTDSSGVPLRLTYSAGRLTRWADRIGTWYAYDYDEQGRCVRGSGKAGVFDVELDYDDGVTRARDSLGHVTTYHYNELFQVVRETDPLGNETRYTWDRHDHLLARTDALGRTSGYDYSATGELTAITRPDGARRLIADDAVTDFDGVVWPRAHDERGNLTADAFTGRDHAYDEHGHLTAVTDALGHTHTIRTDPAGLPIAVTDPLGAITRYERDAFGRITAITDPLGATTRYTWSVEGRPTGRTLPSGASERWRYDAEGNLIEHVDALGQTTRVEIGPFDLPVARVTPDGARLEFGYDTELRLTTVTDPRGHAWHYAYDPAGNLTGETDFDGRTLSYTRDATGDLVERVNGAGESTRYTRDALGRVTEQRSGDRVTTFAHDPLGRLISARNPDADLRLTRDAHGRVLAETCNGRTVTSSYDAAGRRVLRRTPSGAESAWDYDARDRVLSLRTAGHALYFTYDEAGRETARHLGTAVALTHEWDPDSRLRAQTLLAGRGRPVQRRAYSYRPDGHLTRVDDLLAGSRRYDLDPLGRVTSVTGTGWTERYAYDEAGRVTHASWPSPADADGPRAYAGTRISRAGRVRYEHDAQGRTTLRQKKSLSGRPRTWHYTWDSDDRLTGVTTPDGTRWHYLYDPLGRRIAKQRADGTGRVDFVWDGTVLAEQLQAGNATSWDWEPGTFRPLTQTERHPLRDAPQEWVDERFYAIATDLVGTPSELVTPGGDLAWRARHTLWGSSFESVSGDADCPLRFPGQYADEESGLHYNHFRHYDPAAHSYRSPDPLGLLAGPDHHAYVSNPTTRLDPLGLMPYEGGKWMSPDSFAAAEAREARNMFRTRAGATETGQHDAGLLAGARELRRRVRENGYLPEINDQLLETAQRWEARGKGVRHGMQRGR
ncbi:DUF6531 domain-containing protein [Nonomuraea sp. SBT364]|uniref:DUF6531 domain-containing protein n=1 Tax=Nonomuraea sp. SBT364 TaxID=1580530 RepID=UPI00069E9E73|nr:DUF6531 domain-containing protein [Nonomuraea sp. SBT364]